MSALASPAMDARLASPGWIASGQARSLFERIVPTRLERWLILGGLLWTTLQALVAMAVLLAWDRFILGGLENATDATSPIEVPTEPFWSLLLLGIAIVVAVASLAAIILALRGRERQAIRFALGATLVGLVAGDLVAFYAFQIAALASTVFDLLLLGLIIDYRVRIERRADRS